MKFFDSIMNAIVGDGASHDEYLALIQTQEDQIEKLVRTSQSYARTANYFLKLAQDARIEVRAERKRAADNLAWSIFFLGLLLIEGVRVAMASL